MNKYSIILISVLFSYVITSVKTLDVKLTIKNNFAL